MSVKFEFTTVGKFPSAEKINAKLEWGISRGLTRTAQAAQKAVLNHLHRSGTFTIRGRWTEPQTKYGIKITAASKTRQYSEVRTAANWLTMHQKGGIKRPISGGSAMASDLLKATRTVTRGKNRGQVRPAVGKKRAGALAMARQSLAIPTREVRYNKRAIIRAAMRPRRLKNTFKAAINFGGKTVEGLWKRVGRNIRLAYRLIGQGRIRKVPTFFEPIQKTIARHRTEFIEAEVAKAMKEIR